jgi:hypothetical protein
VSEPATSGGEAATSSSILTPDPGTGRRPRWRLPLAVLLLGALLVTVSATVHPLQQSCDSALTAEVCLETVDAALRKGMPRLHPLLLAAHVEPGPAARPDQFGHRATVTFEVLAGPGPTSVRMFFDAGGHWGGIASRGAAELALWAVAQGVAIAAITTGGLWHLLRRRRAGR